MTNTQRRIYAAIVSLHPSDFRSRFGREMILDFDDASASHDVANFYLDALQSVVRQWASHLFPSALGPLPAQASLLSGQYVSLSQRRPSLFELVRASCFATLLFLSIGFAAAPRLSVEQSPTPPPTPRRLRAFVVPLGTPPAALVLRTLPSRKQDDPPGPKVPKQTYRRHVDSISPLQCRT